MRILAAPRPSRPYLLAPALYRKRVRPSTSKIVQLTQKMANLQISAIATAKPTQQQKALFSALESYIPIDALKQLIWSYVPYNPYENTTVTDREFAHIIRSTNQNTLERNLPRLTEIVRTTLSVAIYWDGVQPELFARLLPRLPSLHGITLYSNFANSQAEANKVQIFAKLSNHCALLEKLVIVPPIFQTVPYVETILNRAKGLSYLEYTVLKKDGRSFAIMNTRARNLWKIARQLTYKRVSVQEETTRVVKPPVGASQRNHPIHLLQLTRVLRGCRPVVILQTVREPARDSAAVSAAALRE